ncbi:Cys-Gln thioester bond-forming surface protein [Streptomyces sp. R302]|uniref:Cys-Gln thioester bond-forming surface protein n=1 Tax=unclassified Streptomyces TaxID=2593676 RepID=UPI00145E0065|nr:MULTISPECIES: Cys-Gln thioester bond-forming surface protein [unclassified Streptomyces]NML49031.1 Cys-Gln thioester bond-forming surface protein [Streptomyces sp. R301]NML77358.1 Cys-Gln thioester bond-forming surface protein [Streptomyces sp. R302]
MFSVRGRGAARLAAATLVSGLVASSAIALAGPAMADGGADATLGGLKESGKIWIGDEEGDPIRGGLFELTVDGGGSLQAYCIDLLTPTDPGTKYKETDWDKSTLHDNPNAGKIRWILQNSYPEVNDLGALADKAGVDALTGDEAATATQAAIWKYSDNVTATPVDPEAKALAGYLVAEAAKAPDQEEPKVSLAAAPASIAGKAGDKLGPVKVTTTAADGAVKVSLPADAPANVKVVDKDGKAVTSAGNNTELFLDVPAGTPDGTTKIGLQTETEVAIGRVFGSVEGHEQTLILAGSSKSTVNAEVTAAWAKKGAVPAVTVTENCAKGGLDITASNEGDEDWTFDVKGISYTIKAGESKTVTVPVAEDTAYDFTITGPNGFSKSFQGVLDCKTAPSPEPSTGTPSATPSTGTSETPSASPSTPAPSTSTDASTGTTGTTGGDLAETGSSNATPMIAGIAVALVLVGGGAVFFLRKKKAAAGQ